MATSILQRVKLRVNTDSTITDDLLNDCIQTMTDRLCLRLGVEELPTEFESILVDAVVKMVRRLYYEGISQEGVSNINTSFVEDILAEYQSEIDDYRRSKEGMVHFL